MVEKPTYEELEYRVKLLEREAVWRMQAEEVLCKSEEKYRIVAENVTDVVFQLDLDGNFTFLSPSCEPLTGYTVEEGLSMNIKEIMTADAYALVTGLLEERLWTDKERKGQYYPPIVAELEMLQKNGAKFWAEATAKFHRDKDDNAVGVTGVLRDITDRKNTEKALEEARDELETRVKERTAELLEANKQLQKEMAEREHAENALRESEKKYATVVENSKDGIVMISDGKLKFVNKASVELVGYTPDEMGDDNFLNYVASDYRDLVIQRYIDRMEGKEVPSIYEIELLRKDGKTVPVELNAMRIDYKGKPADLVFIRDITVRKQTVAALRESEDRYRTLTNNLNVGVYRNTAGPDGKFIEANPAIVRMFGYDGRAEFLAVSVSDLYQNPDDRKKFNEKMLREGAVRNEEEHLQNKDGTPFIGSVSAVAVKNEKGEVQYYDGVVEDITERKRMESQLQQAQKMESLGTLAGGIAHDFNNLLMGIQGRTSLILMDNDSSHPHFEHLKGIEDYIKSAADLTNQLLGFARGGKYEVKPTDLNRFIKRENEMFGRTRKEINIQEQFEKNLWITDVDQGQIEQVILNVYVNACQAMPGGGNLYVRTENIIIDQNYIKPYQVEPGRYVKISITDTGVGMDKETQRRIFDPFFTTKEMGRGTGLGLATAYGIIKNHHGFINVYSEKGKGTTFNIYLPASEKTAVKPKEPYVEWLIGTETILLIDDEDMILDVGRGIIENLGYEVLIAKSGKEAVETYKKNMDTIDMVILDMIMPEMSGGETFDRLKEINPDIKALLSSGYSIDGQATEILDRGCNGFIQKPFNIAKLSKKLREILAEP